MYIFGKHVFIINTYSQVIFVEIEKRADICIIIDSSRSRFSHHRNNWNRIKTELKRGVSRLKISSDGNRVALVLTSTKPYVILKLNTENTLDGILRKIDTLRYLGGSRNMAAGLYLVNHVVFRPENGDRPDAENIVILIMCGRSKVNSRYAVMYAKEARDTGIRISAIAITTFDIGELNTVASPPIRKTVFQVNSADELYGAFLKAFGETGRPTGSPLPSRKTTSSLLNSCVYYV